MSLSLRIKLYPGPSKNQNQRNAIFFRDYVLKPSNGLHTRSHSAQVVNYSEIYSAKTATHSPTSVRRQCHAGERLATFRDNVEPGWIAPPLLPPLPHPSLSLRLLKDAQSHALLGGDAHGKYDRFVVSQSEERGRNSVLWTFR